MTTYEYESLGDANAEVNRLLAELEEANARAQKSLVAMLVSESVAAQREADLCNQLAAMTARKDGWRKLTRGLYRYALSESVGGEVEGTYDCQVALYIMRDEIRRHIDDIDNGVRMWGRGTYDGTVQP